MPTAAGPRRALRRRARVCAILAACWSGVPLQAAPATPTEPVVVGVFTVAPFILPGPNGPQGALIDFFDHEIAPRMGVRFQWQRPVTVARLEISLASGAVLFTPILARTPQRDSAGIRFDDTAYIKFEPCIAVLPGHRLDHLRSASDLAGMTIGWAQAGVLPPFMHDPAIRLDLVGGVDWEKVNLGKLQLERIDGAYFSNCASASYYAARNNMKLKLLAVPVPGVTLYGAFSPLAPPELVQRYRIAAQQAFAGGRFDNYLNQALRETHP